MFVLDTNVLSGLRRRDKADRRLLAWAESRSVEDFYTSVISILELEIGTLLLARRDALQARVYRRWLDTVLLPHFEGRILPVDTAVAIACANMHVPDPKPERDALIAATALVHDKTVVTRNARDFKGTGVRLFNPWEEPI